MRGVALRWTLLLLVLCATPIRAVDLYVSPDGSETTPYTNWATAAHTIQTAVDAASSDDTIWVGPGDYAAGCVTNDEGRSRVAVRDRLVLHGVAGPEATVIRGNRVAVDGQVRCVWLGSNVILEGFALVDGSALPEPDAVPYGGGAYLLDGARISHCIIRNNIAESGGGVAGTTSSVVSNCVVEGNTALNHGGGVLLATSWNCTIQSNSAHSGGGVGSGDGFYCVIRGNHADQGGGAHGNDEFRGWMSLRNCAIVENSVALRGGGICGEAGAHNCTFANIDHHGYGREASEAWLENCLVFGPPFGIDWCNTFNCLETSSSCTFVNSAIGDYRLHPASPAINRGSTNRMSLAEIQGTDLAGHRRVAGGEVDVGAYEFQGASDGAVPGAWLAGYGLPTNQTANFADPDQDGYNTWEEYVADTEPTNAASRFAVAALPGDEGGGFIVAWPAATGRLYNVETAYTPAGPWDWPATIAVASNGLYRWDAAPAGSPQVYRVGIALQSDW